jgi:hypothetical protein
MFHQLYTSLDRVGSQLQANTKDGTEDDFGDQGGTGRFSTIVDSGISQGLEVRKQVGPLRPIALSTSSRIARPYRMKDSIMML